MAITAAMDMYTSNTSSACHKAIASRLAPTVNRAHPQNHIDRQTAIAGKPAPTGDLLTREILDGRYRSNGYVHQQDI